MRRGFALTLCLAIASLGLTAAQAADPPRNTPGRYAPRDECRMLPGAVAFRSALGRAVRRRDATAVAALAADDILLDFGGGSGREELRQRLRGEGGRAIWRELDTILALGCSQEHGDMVMPWFFSQDLGDADPFGTWLVTAANVPVFAKPNAMSRRAGQVSWQLVEIAGDYDPAKPFQQVRLAGGGKPAGYIATARLRSPIGYRLVASRTGGNWKIDAFVTGD